MAIEALARIMTAVQMNSQALNLSSQGQSQKRNEGQLKVNSYKCDKCRDRGMIIIEQKNLAPLIVSCKCKEIEKLKSRWTSSGINPEESTQTFSNFKIWNESSKIARETAMGYYKEFNSIRKERNNSLLLCGQVGSGKSHLTIALGLNFLKNNIKVVYMPYRDVMTSIKQNMLDYEYYKKTISKYQTCEVLLMDDLFKGKITESDINIIFEILNYRYLNHLPIIVSTECTVERLLYHDEAIGSRLYEMCKNYTVEIKKSKENNYRLR